MNTMSVMHSCQLFKAGCSWRYICWWGGFFIPSHLAIWNQNDTLFFFSLSLQGWKQTVQSSHSRQKKSISRLTRACSTFINMFIIIFITLKSDFRDIIQRNRHPCGTATRTKNPGCPGRLRDSWQLCLWKVAMPLIR